MTNLKDNYFSLGGDPIAITPTSEYFRKHINDRKCWPEDYSHENGNYFNNCIKCKEMFIGHKRRITCKECTKPKWLISAKEIKSLIKRNANYSIECLKDKMERFFNDLALKKKYPHLRNNAHFIIPLYLHETKEFKNFTKELNSLGYKIKIKIYKDKTNTNILRNPFTDQVHISIGKHRNGD